jgi:hypothetical protein
MGLEIASDSILRISFNDSDASDRADGSPAGAAAADAAVTCPGRTAGPDTLPGPGPEEPRLAGRTGPGPPSVRRSAVAPRRAGG